MTYGRVFKRRCSSTTGRAGAGFRQVLFTLVLALPIACSQEAQKVVEPPVSPPTPAVSPEELIRQLADAYRNVDRQHFVSLLADGSEGPMFRFAVHPIHGADGWDFAEEARIHQRMFEPGATPSGQPPVPAVYHLESIGATLQRASPFEERPEFYSGASNPNGLDPIRWRVTGAIYIADVLFNLVDELDFQVTARADFVVVEDREKQVDEEGKFKLLQWSDLPYRRVASGDPSWSAVKKLYR